MEIIIHPICSFTKANKFLFKRPRRKSFLHNLIIKSPINHLRVSNVPWNYKMPEIVPRKEWKFFFRRNFPDKSSTSTELQPYPHCHCLLHNNSHWFSRDDDAKNGWCWEKSPISPLGRFNVLESGLTGKPWFVLSSAEPFPLQRRHGRPAIVVISEETVSA